MAYVLKRKQIIEQDKLSKSVVYMLPIIFNTVIYIQAIV